MFSASGDQGREWRLGRVSLLLDADARLQFRAARSAAGTDSAVALDDVSVEDTPCSE